MTDTKKLFIVDTITTFRHRYVIEANELSHAYDEVTMIDSGNALDTFESITQKCLGESIINGREITKEDFNNLLVQLKEDTTGEISSFWLGENLIRRINYDR